MAVFDHDGIRLHYLLDGQGEPVLLLHGLGASHREWEYQVPALAKKYQLILPDARGHGLSDRPTGPYSIRGFARDFWSLLDHLGLPSVHLVGFSMGGMVAFQMAVDDPARVRSLSIVNSLPAVNLQTWKQRSMLLFRLLLFYGVGLPRMAEIMSQRLFPEPHQQDLRRRLVQRFSENSPRAYRSSMNAIVGWSVEDRLSELTMPVLVVSSDQDYTTPEEKRSWVQKIPHAQFEIVPNSRHVLPLDQPEQLNHLLLAFLDRVRPKKVAGH